MRSLDCLQKAIKTRGLERSLSKHSKGISRDIGEGDDFA